MARHRDLELMNGAVRLGVRDYGGQGPPVLLMHGGGRSLLDWELMVPHLLEHHRVAAFDLRGHGCSDDGAWEWSAVQEDCLAVIAGLEYERPALVGHSLGGMLAAMLAAVPGRCRVAVNLDGHGTIDAHEYQGIDAVAVTRHLAAQERQVSQALAAMRPLTTEDELALAEMLATAQAAAAGMPAALAAAAWKRSLAQRSDGGWVVRPTPEVAADLLTAVAALDLFQVYRACRSPLLVFNAQRVADSGSGEAVAFARAHREALGRLLNELAAVHEHMRVECVDATHGLIFEQPDSLAVAIMSFIAANP